VGERTFGNIIPRGPESQLIRQVIESLDLGKLSVFKNVSIERGIRKPSAADGWLQSIAVSLHRKCPVTPHRSTKLDAICNVKEGMDCNWASR
jgi:hypothetical protein